tara:strand:- start:1889 stop:2641 length:753 start_codon:yes stop_codon:yes gene_type:complete
MSTDDLERLLIRNEIRQFLIDIEFLKEDIRSNPELYLSENVSFFDALGAIGGNFAGDISAGAFSALTETIIDLIFEVLGITSDSLLEAFFIELFKEFIENVLIAKPGNIALYMDDKKGCSTLADDITMVMGKSGGDIMVKVVVNYIKSEEFERRTKENEGGEGSIVGELMGQLSTTVLKALSDNMIVGAIGKIVKEAFEKDMVEQLQPFVRRAVCQLNLTEEIPKMFGFGASPDSDSPKLPQPAMTNEED